MYSHENLPNGAAVGRDPSQPLPSTPVSTTSFGAPGADATVHRIDLNEALIRHPQATFVVRATGNAMRSAGINDGDVLLVDRAITAGPNHVVVALVEGELCVRRLAMHEGVLRLRSDDSRADFVPQDGQQLELWGVVTTVIKSLLP